MKNISISIIVPVYKVEKYLSKCVESILAQTFADFELILVDDGSPDRCGELCDEYALKDNRIKVIHKENGGLSDARNAGIKIARGEYLAFVDSDDYIAPDMYEILYALAKEHEADISVCDAVLVKEDEEAIYQDSSTVNVFDHKKALVEMTYNRSFTVNAWNKLYKKELFADILYPKGMLYEDLATTYKLVDRSQKIVYTSAKKYAYVQRGGSIMNQTGYKMKADKVVIVDEMMDYFQGRKDEQKLFAGAVNYLLNDIYKMASTRNLTACVDYTDALKGLVKKNKNRIKGNKYLSFKDKKILIWAVKHKKILQFLYSKMRRG